MAQYQANLHSNRVNWYVISQIHAKSVQIQTSDDTAWRKLYTTVIYGEWKGFDMGPGKWIKFKFGKDRSALIWGIQLPKPMPKDQIKLKIGIDYYKDNDDGYIK